jgi:hypothetical protein
MSDTDRLVRFRKGETVTNTNPDTKSASGKQPYQAYQVSKESQRFLELRLKYPEPAECPLYAMISLMQLEWRWGLGITLIFGNNTMVVAIKGKNLQSVADSLKEGKVIWLTEFDPESHLPVTNEEAPFIKSIEIITTRPDSPPPMSQRH